jgi:hypothetical protein
VRSVKSPHVGRHVVRSLIVAVAGLFVLASLGGAPASARTSSDLLTAVERLAAAPPVPRGYAFRDFARPSPARADARGCGKRERVLIASATVAPRVGPGCQLIGGAWVVNQGAKTIRGAGRVDVVSLVSDKSVWSQGAFGWSNDQRRGFVRWQQRNQHECALDRRSPVRSQCLYLLQERGTGGRNASVTDVMSQTSWRLTCPEAAGIVRVLSTWGLAIDPAAKSRIHAAGCDRVPVSYTLRNRINPIPPSTAGNPFLSPASAARQWTPSNVLNAPPGPVITPELFGLHVPEPFGPEPEVPFAWLRLWDAKTGWEPLEQNRGIYYWKTLDDSLAFAEARGLRVLYVFGDTPPWAGPDATMPPTSLAEYQRFVEALVTRYGNRIHAYEVWNEPNLHNPMSKQVANLVEMTKVLYSTVKRVNPNALVLSPSTTMRTDTIVYPFFTDYLQPLAAAGWPVDGYTFHTYPRASGGPAQRAGALAQFKQLLALARAPTKPIWDTEINYGLGGLQEQRRVIAGREAEDYITQTFLDSVRFGVARADWYLWFPRDYNLLGIQLNPGTPGTIAAWRRVYDQLVGSQLLACAEQKGEVTCGFLRDGRRFTVTYRLDP